MQEFKPSADPLKSFGISGDRKGEGDLTHIFYGSLTKIHSRTFRFNLRQVYCIWRKNRV